LWTKLEIVLSRNDHFFGDGLSSLSFLFPPNVKQDVLGYTVLPDIHTPPQTTPKFSAMTGDHSFKIDMRAPLAMVTQRLALY
jgi:hypothetical protein